MIKYVWLTTCALLLIAASICGYRVGYSFGKGSVKCQECPKIVPQIIERIDTVIKHIAVPFDVPVANVVASRRNVTVYRTAIPSDTPKTVPALPAVVPVNEEVREWALPMIMPDSALIITRLTSRILPVAIPYDLNISGEYTASPRVRIERITERVWMPAPSCSNARRFGWTVGPYLGVGYGLYGLDASVGFAVTWGIRLGKLYH